VPTALTDAGLTDAGLTDVAPTVVPQRLPGLRGVPHPVPYQGSKRRIASAIVRLVPAGTTQLVEPFAGSAAVSLAVRRLDLVPRVTLSDVNAPLMALWRCIRDAPEQLADAYADVWHAGVRDPDGQYLAVREAFNGGHDPAHLLYLLARCVKAAVRYSADGRFNQSADRRRVGRRPDAMRRDLVGAGALLHGSTVEAGDFRARLLRAAPTDVVYLDPPYQGVTGGRDRRYVAGVRYDAFVADLRAAREAGVSFLLSYDGATGEQLHGEPLPADLGLRRVLVAAGRSAQATLLGRDERTVESLYLSPALVDRLAPAVRG
jgi:DNA adenine methylase